MDLWQLQIFCKVIEHKSFSAAGKTVHLSQPTISSHMKDLETNFGCRLIDRLSKAAVPTPSGKVLYRYAKKMITLKQETETAMSVKGLRLRRSFYLTTNKQRSTSPLNHAFINFLKERVGRQSDTTG